MSGTLSEIDILLALHRRLYLLEGEERQLDMNCRVELYSLLKEGWPALGEKEQKYILGYILDEDLSTTEKILKRCAGLRIKVLSWLDRSYPFHTVSSLPPVMFMKGDLPDPVKNPYIAIVGSRKATDYGREMTLKIVRELAPFNATIVSGLAYGIDAAAHRAALKCGLPTVAVMGCGINCCYPAQHMELSDEIACKGAVISEFPWGTPPLKHNFPMRNRVISGISRAVVVIEAELKSGSLITANWAADQGKEVFAVPGNAGRGMSSGTNWLIKQGAHLLEEGSDIAGVLHLEGPLQNNELEKNSGHDEASNGIKRAILDFLKSGGENLEKLVEETNLSVEELLPLITEAELLK